MVLQVMTIDIPARHVCNAYFAEEKYVPWSSRYRGGPLDTSPTHFPSTRNFESIRCLNSLKTKGQLMSIEDDAASDWRCV